MIEPAEDISPGEPAWRKKGRPRDRVLFATDGRGTIVRIDSIGPITEYLGEGDEDFLDEVKDHPFPGLWIWEGRIRAHEIHTDNCHEWDVWLEGDIRPLHEDERASLQENDDPWDRSLWYEPPADGPCACGRPDLITSFSYGAALRCSGCGANWRKKS